MTSRLKTAFCCIPSVLLTVTGAALAQTAAPPNVVVYFINLKDGDSLKSPFKVQFGLSGMANANGFLLVPDQNGLNIYQISIP